MNEDVHYLQSYAEDYATSIGLPSGAAYALIDSESSFRNIEADDGLGYGPAQISYDLAAERGIDIYDPQQNIKLGLDYLKEQYDATGGDLEAAYAYYKHGPNAGVTRSEYSALAMERYNNFNGTDTSYAYPSDEQELDLSHDLPEQDGIEDAGLFHTDKALAQRAIAFNGEVYRMFGRDMVLSGGWRSEDNNRAVGGAPNSDHLYGMALDFNMDNFDDEERQQIMQMAEQWGFSVLWHDAGTGLHLHLGIADPDMFQYIPQEGDYLPAVQTNTGWFGDGAVSNPWSFTKEQILGSYNMNTSGFWKSVEEPTTLQALAHGWERGNNFFTNFLYQLEADLFHSDNSIEHWEASTEDLDRATELLYGSREEAERIAKMARDKTQFDYFLQDRKEFLDEEVKYRDYYNGLGIHWLGTMAAGVIDPTIALPGGQLAKAANIAKTAAAIKIARNIGSSVKNVEAIERISKISAALAAKKGYSSALKQAEHILNVTRSHAGAQGIIQTTAKAGFSGAVTNIAQDYLVSKATYNDTHMQQAAIMGAVGGSVLHVLGRTAKLARHGASSEYVKRTQKMRSAAERIEEGTLREAAGLQNQYKVSMEHVIERMAHAVDGTYFKQFGDDITAITDRNRVFAIARADAEKIAGDAGVQLDPKARAFHEPATKTTFVIKEAVKDKDALYGLLRHEIGVHQNLKVTMGDENYQRLMNQIEQGRQNPESVWARASAETDSFDPEEILGYAIEHNMLNAHEARHLLKGIKQGLNKMGLGKRDKWSDKEILDFVSESLANARADKHGLAMHVNPDGSVVLNGLKFSKENMGNPNALMDTLNMSIAGIKNKPTGVKNAILDAMDGKGVFNRFTATQFGDAYHSPVPAISKYAAELWTDEQGRGTARIGKVKGMMTAEEMADWIQGQLISPLYRIGEHRNAWLQETQGRFAVQNPYHADSRRQLFNKAAELRFNQDYAGIVPRNLPKDLADMMDNPHVIAAAKEMKQHREQMIDMAKTSGEKFGLTDDESYNLMEKAWEAVDEEWYRVADDDSYMWLVTHFGSQGDEGIREFLVSYAKTAANREKTLASMIRDQKLKQARELRTVEEALKKAPESEELKAKASELRKEPTFTKEEVEAEIEARAEGFAHGIMKERYDEAFDNTTGGAVGELSFFKQRLPMDTSLEMELPDGYVFSFDKDLRSYDIDYIMQKTTRRLAGEAAMKNFLNNQGLTLSGWRSQVVKQIDALKGSKLSAGQVPYYKDKFDDMVKDLRGMSSRQDNYGVIGATAKIFKNLAYSNNGGMMGFNQLQDLASAVAHNGWGSIASIFKTTMNRYLTTKLGKDNLDELNNLSMMLEGEQLYGQLFKTGFRDYSTRQAIATASSRPRRFIADAADFTRNLANVVSHYNGLGRLTDNQHKMATIQAIVDAAQWAYGRKFSKWRNPFSEAKLKELGVSTKEISQMQQDIRTYLGWKGTKDSDFTGSRWRDWMKESPTTFWHFRQLIHNQATRSVISDSRGNANMLMKNSMLASALLMFKGFTFRANNARFARALRAGDMDDALAFGLDMLFGGLLFAARQGIKVGALLALGQTEQAQELRKKYLNEDTIARAVLFRSAYTAPVSLLNDFWEAGTGAPTIRTTTTAARRTRSPQDAGDYVGNFVGQTPVISTVDAMTIQPLQAINAFWEGRGSQTDLRKLTNVVPFPNLLELPRAVGTLIRAQIASGLDLPERRPTRRTSAAESQQSTTEQITNLFK